MDEPMNPAGPAMPMTSNIRNPGCSRYFLIGFLIVSVLINFGLCLSINLFRSPNSDDDLEERHLFDHAGGGSKIAVIQVEGVLIDGMLQFPYRQIETVARDEGVKAVVLRIDSPGGTVSASEDLFKRLKQLRDGRLRKYPDRSPVPIVVSMGSLATSGGYYIAMPAKKIFAERGTLTGSIGVYASLPNVADFLKEHGVRFELIKAGNIKAGGSPFHSLTPQERQPWQDMVDHAYDQFLDVIVEGRPNLTKALLRDTPLNRPPIVVRDDKGHVVKDWWGRPRTIPQTRFRADGGTFTASEAKELGLIDEIGDLEDAADAAASLAQLSKYSVISYKQPYSFFHSLLEMRHQVASPAIQLPGLSRGLTPRLWYLGPQADLAGLLAGIAQESGR